MANSGCPIGSFNPDLVKTAEHVMLASNRPAADAMLTVGVNACTDVTGFGLIGHLMEMLQINRVSAELHFDSVPLLPGAMALAEEGIVPSGSERNAAYWWKACHFASGVRDAAKMVLFDAQTSGGLLMSVDPEKADMLISRLLISGIEEAAIVGHIVGPSDHRITVASDR
jgi:selenide,water dikinase